MAWTIQGNLKGPKGADSDSEVLASKVTNIKGASGLWVGTQAEYDALATKDPNVLYFRVN